MKVKNVILIFITAIALGTGGYLWQQHSTQHSSAAQGQHEDWYCPMHPQIIYDHPGHCPICGMDLVKKVSAPAVKGSGVEGYTTITENAQKEQLIGLRTQVVEAKPVIKLIRTFGTVASDIDFYQKQSEFIDAYVSYINVFRNYKQIRGRLHVWESHRDLQTRLLDAKDKLLKLGLNEDEITKLQDVTWNGVWKQPKLLLFSDSRNYWVMAQVFEQDFSYVHEGQKVDADIPALHARFKGVIRSIGGFIDPVTRSVTALVELDDQRVRLAANMLVDVTISVRSGNGLFVPRQAVMDTGARKIVFVSKESNSFEPREIKTGMETDDGFEVKSGLKPGERIVISGNFLLDSESRVQAGLEKGASS